MGAKTRESNIELLRIVAMFLVVLSHFYVHGQWPLMDSVGVNNVVRYALDVGEIGVTTFVLISGYFLINQSFDLIKLSKLVLQMWFYGVGLLIFAYVFDTRVITAKHFWGSIMPFNSLNWFAKAHLLLYLLFPLLNVGIKRLSEKSLKRFILGFGFLWTVLPVLSLYEHGNQRVTIMFIYCVGAYFCLFGCKWFDNPLGKIRAISLMAVSYSIIVFTVVVLWKLSLKDANYVGKEASFLSLNSVLVLLCGIGLFYLLKKIKLESALINKIAKTMFGVYLIHDNALISAWMWNGVLKIGQYYDSAFLIPISVLCSILVMVVCSSIDYLRIVFVEKPVFSVITPMLSDLQNKLALRMKIIRNTK